VMDYVMDVCGSNWVHDVEDLKPSIATMIMMGGTP
jgi:hypothetical protein